MDTPEQDLAARGRSIFDQLRADEEDRAGTGPPQGEAPPPPRGDTTEPSTDDPTGLTGLPADVVGAAPAGNGAGAAGARQPTAHQDEPAAGSPAQGVANDPAGDLAAAAASGGPAGDGTAPDTDDPVAPPPAEVLQGEGTGTGAGPGVDEADASSGDRPPAAGADAGAAPSEVGEGPEGEEASSGPAHPEPGSFHVEPAGAGDGGSLESAGLPETGVAETVPAPPQRAVDEAGATAGGPGDERTSPIPDPAPGVHVDPAGAGGSLDGADDLQAAEGTAEGTTVVQAPPGPARVAMSGAAAGGGDHDEEDDGGVAGAEAAADPAFHVEPPPTPRVPEVPSPDGVPEVPSGVAAPPEPADAVEASGRFHVEPEAASAPGPAPVRPVRALPRIMAVANQKGGVGKTTTAVNLGAALAELGYRTLVVDLDPQGNATTGLGINARNLDTSVYDVLMRELPVEDAVEPTSVRNLFVVPATIDLAGAEIELVPAFSRELRLKRALEGVVDDFDFTLIDCPPSLGLLTVNALAAATEVVVPVQCEYYALEGLSALLRNVQLVQTNLNRALEMSTIILTMYDARTKLAEQVATEVRLHFGNVVCRQMVPRTVRLSEAPSFGQPIIVFDPSSRGAIAYRELAKEVSGGTPQRVG